MRYLSLFSGIEAASCAWDVLGWTPVGFSEIEPFACELLKRRFPKVPNYGDVTKFKEWPIETGSFDLLIGGSPCQAFSVAGLRKGLEDPRGNLTLTYLSAIDHFKPKWVIWENVPGVLSIDNGRVFGTFLGALGELGFQQWAYRILDAQHFGVPQRRRRVFVVARSGEGPHPAAVLFEPQSLQRDPSTRRKTRKGSSSPAGEGVDERGLQRTVGTLCADTHPGAYSGQDAYTGRLIPQTSGSHWDHQANPHPNLTTATGQIGYSNQEVFSQRGGGLVPHTEIYLIQDGREITKHQNGLGISDENSPAYTLDTTGAQSVAVCPKEEIPQVPACYDYLGSQGGGVEVGISPTLKRKDGVAVALPELQVRRLTPEECEKLQGFEPGWTAIPYNGKQAADGPRYKSIGNSMAVPVIRWLGRRIMDAQYDWAKENG